MSMSMDATSRSPSWNVRAADESRSPCSGKELRHLFVPKNQEFSLGWFPKSNSDVDLKGADVRCACGLSLCTSTKVSEKHPPVDLRIRRMGHPPIMAMAILARWARWARRAPPRCRREMANVELSPDGSLQRSPRRAALAAGDPVRSDCAERESVAGRKP